MRELADIFGWVCLFGGLFGIAVLGVAALCVGLADCIKIWRDTCRSWGARTISLFAVVLATRYGGSKVITGRVTVDDPYIVDAGSFVTNDYVHVALAGRYAFIPAETEILIYSRELAQTNAADWVQLVRAEEGPYHLGEFPLDIQFPNATNYNFLVAADYIPAPTVHTNGVWQIKGFVIPAEGSPPSPATFAFPNTVKKEEQ